MSDYTEAEAQMAEALRRDEAAVEALLEDPGHPRTVLAAFFAAHPGSYCFTSYDQDAGSGDEERSRNTVQTDAPGAYCPPAYCEVALDSVVFVDGEPMHIPQLDFASKLPEAVARGALEELTEVFGEEWILFDSGDALHGYLPTLIDDRQWRGFMGQLLLAHKSFEGTAIPNATGTRYKTLPLVDIGWVGRSLMRGHSSLRWTAQNKPQPPRLLAASGAP